MDRNLKHRTSEFLMVSGFLSVVFGGLGSAILTPESSYSVVFGIGGFMVFLIGVELYLKTRKNHQA